jgi:catechol 2,3-dioxygenase-like lactoylglutathione lyase family enzyme
VTAAAREFAMLLGCDSGPERTGFQLERGAIVLEPAAAGLRAIVLQGEPPVPPPDWHGLDVRFVPDAGWTASGPPGEFLGIDHVVVQTGDADAAIALWRDRLGIRLALDRAFPDLGMRLVFLRSAGMTIEFACPLAAASPMEADRLYGVSFAVADLAITRARLIAAGLDVSDIRPGRKTGTRVATVRSAPCGIPTLLVEPATAPRPPIPPA